jgi:hypothetical protein
MPPGVAGFARASLFLVHYISSWRPGAIGRFLTVGPAARAVTPKT